MIAEMQEETSVNRQKKTTVILLAILLIVIFCFAVMMACGKKEKTQEQEASLESVSEERGEGSGDASETKEEPESQTDLEGAGAEDDGSGSEENDEGGATGSGDTDSQQSAPVVNMTTSYAIGRFRFLTITGLSLPELENLDAGEDAYQNGDTSYSFDLIGGEALTYGTYGLFASYFNQIIGTCDEGYPIGTEATGQSVQWTSGDRRYQADWSVAPLRIRIFSTLISDSGEGSGASSEMTESYRAGKEALFALTDVEIPEIGDIALIETSDIDATDGAVCLRFAGNGELFSAIFDVMRDAVYKRSDCVGQGESAVEEADHADWRMVIEIDDRPTLIHVGISISGSTIEIVGEVGAVE